MKIPVIILIIAALAAPAAFGHNAYLASIPNSSVYSCNTCHYQGHMKNDFANNGHQWNNALAIKDSDGDGATNGVELQDPQGNWRPGYPDPHITGWSTYNPDNPNSKPPYTGVAPQSFGRIKALYK